MTRSEYNEILTQLQKTHTAAAIALTLFSRQTFTEDIQAATVPAQVPTPSRFTQGDTVVDAAGTQFIVDGLEYNGLLPCFRLSTDSFGQSTMKVTINIPVEALMTQDELADTLIIVPDTDTDTMTNDVDEVDETKTTIKEGN